MQSVKEIEADLAKVDSEILEAVNSGDEERFHRAKQRREWLELSLGTARDREQREAAEREQEERETLKPEARAAARAAVHEVALEAELAMVRDGVLQIMAAARAMAKKLPDIRAAAPHAVALCERARVPLAPVDNSNRAVADTVARAIWRVKEDNPLTPAEYVLLPSIGFGQ